MDMDMSEKRLPVDLPRLWFESAGDAGGRKMPALKVCDGLLPVVSK